MRKLILTFFLLLIAPQMAHAWWNGEWTARKKITLDTTATGLPLKQEVATPVVLLRLHTGNFAFDSAKVDGADLRFMAEDDKTPLKYHIEKFDGIAQIALVWVQVPKLQPGSKERHIWAYYGNENAVAADDAKGSFDLNQTSVLHFSEAQGAPKDASAYGNHATQFDGSRIPGGMIGSAVAFNGQQSLLIPASPTMKISATTGATISFWVKSSAAQSTPIVTLRDGKAAIVIGIDGSQAYAKVEGSASAGETQRAGNLAPSAWHHVALTVAKELTLYVDGQPVAVAAATSPELQGEVTVGRGFQGEVDELQLSNVARSADAILLAAVGQGPDAKLLALGEDEGKEGDEGGIWGTWFSALTLDGWLAIGILAVMLVIALWIMVVKAIYVNRVDGANRLFMNKFRELSTDLGAIDKTQGMADSFTHSSLYRLYHIASIELSHRFKDTDAAHLADKNLSPQALDAIRASLDTGLVKETTLMNKLMVMLTIAISGGPFIGLLGTVMGVMITFAVIAATGDVNVAAIAPGIAAALMATAAGMAVAIPALFGYNYLNSRIKAITSDMRVFNDELITKLAENYSR